MTTANDEPAIEHGATIYDGDEVALTAVTVCHVLRTPETGLFLRGDWTGYVNRTQQSQEASARTKAGQQLGRVMKPKPPPQRFLLGSHAVAGTDHHLVARIVRP